VQIIVPLAGKEPRAACRSPSACASPSSAWRGASRDDYVMGSVKSLSVDEVAYVIPDI